MKVYFASGKEKQKKVCDKPRDNVLYSPWEDTQTMIYVTSDIHGDYIHFFKMMEKIRLSSEDRLYILGDAVDKGKENLRVLRYIYDSENICLIKGNHEYLCERYLTGTISGNVWDACGGRNTREEVDGLTIEERMKLRDYLRGLPVYKKITTGEKEYFLTHSGFMRIMKSGTPKQVWWISKLLCWQQWRLTRSDICFPMISITYRLLYSLTKE